MDLQAKLSQLAVPDSLHCSDVHCSDPAHSEQRDGFVIDMMSSVIESCHANIPMSGGKKYHPDPDKSCPVEENILGWKEVVHPYRKDAAFWHGVWGSAGRPDRGVLRDIMVRTRNQFHYAVRRVKKMSKSIRAKKLLEAS